MPPPAKYVSLLKFFWLQEIKCILFNQNSILIEINNPEGIIGSIGSVIGISAIYSEEQLLRD